MYNGCISHLDKLNPVQNYPYQQTGVPNITLADSKGYIWLLQVVAGWRKVIDHYLPPYIVIHFETYLRNLQDDYNKFNDGYTGTFHLNRMTPFCQKNFVLDPHSSYKTVRIGTETTDLHLNVVLLTIGVSRVFSESMKIDCLYLLRDELQFDQRLELAFVGSLLNTPAQSYCIMNELIQGTNAQSGSQVPFRFGEHPFYDWEKLTKQTFGMYRGGPYSRYSCGGTDPASIFGSKLEGGDEWRTSGKQKLEDFWEAEIRRCNWGPLPVGLLGEFSKGKRGRSYSRCARTLPALWRGHEADMQLLVRIL
jgi:hypothetical protein